MTQNPLSDSPVSENSIPENAEQPITDLPSAELPDEEHLDVDHLSPEDLGAVHLSDEKTEKVKPRKAKKGKEPHPQSASFQALVEGLKQHSEPEKKLEVVIQFMQESIAQAGSPHFKDFWEAKKLCLELFHENVHPSQRVLLWTKYSELCQEARSLKEMFDEQSSFAAEQIELAIKAMEGEITSFDQLLQQATSDFEFPSTAFTLADNLPAYSRLQRQLQLLNSYATKTNALRKELIKTPMRIKQKNALFASLSHLGDQIFPKRKTLIQEISQLFIQDIEKFIRQTFDHEMKTAQLFHVRDEIKALQSIAKVLTLNTEAFSATRLRLSECWESIKTLIDDKKKGSHEQKELCRQHREQFLVDLEALKKKCEEKQQSLQVLDQELELLISNMRKTELGKQDLAALREKITEIRTFMDEWYKEQQAAKQNSQKLLHAKQVTVAQAGLRQQEALEKKCQELSGKIDELDVEQLTCAYDELFKEVAQVTLQRTQKAALEKLLRTIRDVLSEKKEKRLLALSDDDKEKLSNLRQILQERKERQVQCRQQLEAYRKTQGSSGLDFTVALEANEGIRQEKERLEKIETSIDEIKQQIRNLEKSQPKQ